MSTTTLTRRGRQAADDLEIEIDPRIADRRDAVRRAHRQRRRRTLVALCVVTVVVLGAVGLTRSPALDVDHIDVVGADRTSVEAVVGSSGLTLGAPMTELDLAGARRAIAALPWIADVRVQRQWPNRISIAVRERTPVAAVPTVDDRWALVDGTGRVLAVSDAVSERWLRIEGVPDADEPGTRLADEAADALAVAARLPDELAAGVDRIVRDERGDLALGLPSGPRVLLGSVDDLDAKLAAVLAVFGQVDDCGIDVVDVRAVDQVTVTRVPSCQADAATSEAATVDAGATEAGGADVAAPSGDGDG